MRKNGRFKKFICLVPVLLCFLLAGCKEEAVVADTPKSEDREIVKKTMLEEPETEYEVEPMHPSVLVDLDGYFFEDAKEAVVVSDSLPSSFYLVNAETGENVLRGNVEVCDTTYSESLKAGIMDFSEITEEGKYYIQTELLGQSNVFEIKSEKYELLFKKVFLKMNALRCQGCHSRSIPFESDPSVMCDVSGGWHTGDGGARDVAEGANGALTLLTAYELFKPSFSDEAGIRESGNGIPDVIDEIRFEIEWLKKMQNPETGGVYNSVSLQNVGATDEKALMIGGESTRATAYFCAAMAKFSFVYKAFDYDYAADCLSKAAFAWKCLSSNKDIVSDSLMYRAAVEMYRATGKAEYNEVILKFLSANSSNDFESPEMLDGAVTYISTKRSINANYCYNLMSTFMSNTKNHSDLSEESPLLVRLGEELDENDYIQDLKEYAIIDYILANVGYTSTEKNYIHYLCGRNILSKDYFEFDYNPSDRAKLVLLLAKMVE